MKIAVHLSDTSKPELQRIEVQVDPRSAPRVALRSPHILRKDSTFAFTWSSAVRGLTGLILLQACSTDVIALEGERGSLAAALDSALSKQPVWLCDLFGTESNGNAIAKRLLLRENPERKRPGPVRVSFHSKFITAASLQVSLGDTPCNSQESLALLRDRFLLAWEENPSTAQTEPAPRPIRPISLNDDSLLTTSQIQPASVANGDVVPVMGGPFIDPWWVRALTRIMHNEATAMLAHHAIFRPEALKDELTSIYSSTAYQAVAARHVRITSDLDLTLGSSARLGVYDQSVLRAKLATLKRPLTVNVAITLVPSLALFSYLKHERQLPIQVNYRFAHSLELVRMLERGEPGQLPDAIVLGLVPAVTFLSQPKQNQYHPLMIMPKASNRLVAGRDSQPGQRGQFMLPSDLPTSASYILDSMVAQGRVKRKSTKVLHLEPDEITVRAQQAGNDFRSILWFPHYHLNRLLHGCQLLPPDSHTQDLPTVLLIHESLMYDRNLATALDVALRDAWLSLRLPGGKLDAVIRRIVTDPQYLELFARYTGLYAFDERVFEKAKEEMHAYG